MNIQEIRDRAPDGSTHYRLADYSHNIKYYKLQGEFLCEWYFYSYDGDWYRSKHVTDVNQLKPLY